IGERRAREADHRETLREPARVGEVEEGGDELALRKVARRTEDDHGHRIAYPGDPGRRVGRDPVADEDARLGGIGAGHDLPRWRAISLRSAARPRSISCPSRRTGRTGRSWAASAVKSPSACACLRRPKLKRSPGTVTSVGSVLVTSTKTPV